MFSHSFIKITEIRQYWFNRQNLIMASASFLPHQKISMRTKEKHIFFRKTQIHIYSKYVESTANMLNHLCFILHTRKGGGTTYFLLFLFYLFFFCFFKFYFYLNKKTKKNYFSPILPNLYPNDVDNRRQASVP